MKHSIQLSLLSITNIIFIFFFQWYLLVQLGAGLETDAFFASMTVPQLLLVVISSSLMNVLVPLLSSQTEDQRRHDAWGFIFLIGGLFILLSIALYILAPWWVPIIVPGFTDEGKILTLTLIRIQLISMVLTSIISVQCATCHAKQDFLWVEFTSVTSNVIALLLLIWTLPLFGIIAAAWISVLRVTLQVLLLLPSMGQWAIPNFKRPVVRQAWQRIKPLLLSTTYHKTGPLVDRYLLSMESNGSLSIYYLAHQVYAAASQVLIKAFIAPMLPLLSKLDNAKRFRHVYYHKLLQVCVISLTVIFFIFVFGKPILSLLLSYGNFNTGNVEQLWLILIYLSGMFFGGIVGQVATSAFYATGDTVTITLMATFTYTVYLPIKITAFYIWGISGLAASTSIYLIINMALSIYLFEKTNSLKNMDSTH